MALIYCRECGNQISDQALNCPKCGAPQPKQNKKRNNNGLIIFLIILVLIGFGYFYFLNNNPENTSEDRQERIDAADRLLSKNCVVLTNMSTEYIKNDIAASILNALGDSKCDCIKKKLREKLADKYTLSDLQDFDKKPIHQVLEIKQLVEENNEELKECFPLLNQVKEAVLKK